MIVRTRFRFLFLFFFLLAALVLVCPMMRAQDSLTCDADDVDWDNCGSCDYGYNLDGTCQDEGDGGGACISDNPSFLYLITYNDVEIDGNGNLDIWAVTANSNGGYNEGLLIANVSGTLPDGSALPGNNNSTTVDPSVSAFVSTEGIDLTSMIDLDLGYIQFYNEYDSSCGDSFYAISFPTLSIKRGYYAWTGNSNPYSQTQKACFYTINCIPGTTATCGSYSDTNIVDINEPCWQYIVVTSLYVNDGSTQTCFPGLSFSTGGMGACT